MNFESHPSTPCNRHTQPMALPRPSPSSSDGTVGSLTSSGTHSGSSSGGPSTPLFDEVNHAILGLELFEPGSAEYQRLYATEDVSKANPDMAAAAIEINDMNDQDFESVLEALSTLFTTRLKAERNKTVTTTELAAARQNWIRMGAPIFRTIVDAFGSLSTKRQDMFSSRIKRWSTGGFETGDYLLDPQGRMARNNPPELGFNVAIVAHAARCESVRLRMVDRAKLLLILDDDVSPSASQICGCSRGASSMSMVAAQIVWGFESTPSMSREESASRRATNQAVPVPLLWYLDLADYTLHAETLRIGFPKRSGSPNLRTAGELQTIFLPQSSDMDKAFTNPALGAMTPEALILSDKTSPLSTRATSVALLSSKAQEDAEAQQTEEQTQGLPTALCIVLTSVGLARWAVHLPGRPRVFGDVESRSAGIPELSMVDLRRDPTIDRTSPTTITFHCIAPRSQSNQLDQFRCSSSGYLYDCGVRLSLNISTMKVEGVGLGMIMDTRVGEAEARADVDPEASVGERNKSTDSNV
ncbi:hypothetical protein BKA70DRAFT_1216654 [Coprinopsis sp. MPI-PUGE-AT-0042]|nr:hypothetical protein BKA70DRAFT_1216654 [Coprinopsis sp. MPI-PUGE-AT-0042]